VAITDLLGDEVVEKINRWRFEEQVVWNDVMEKARIAVSQTAGSDQQGDGNRNCEIHRERVAESLDEYLTSEFTCKEKRQSFN
jgi:hypothetical protein